ncbi:MAG TPA: gamma-glutamylcyclotransferase family protein [Pyrinomonadaceae bacterium]|nr:gamma-glutamylcyclotransferase family protein [Pyrinomonadaceae bacterium]
MNKQLVFVYGTLRRGGVRAMPELFPRATFVGSGSVRGSLYDMGEYPGLQLDDSGSMVTGEVYEIDDETLGRLDEIEAPAHYRRTETEVSLGSYRVTCWVYLFDPDFYPEVELIASGDWIEYAGTKESG